MTEETRKLASFAADLTLEQVPEPIRAIAIDLLVDQLGIQIGCAHLPWAQAVRKTYQHARGLEEATVVRYGDKLPVTSAAFINSTFGHSFEYDDANPLIHGHIGGELIPPLLALSERDHLSGRQFLSALIAGYEVRGRIGWAVSPTMLERGGPQYSTTCGPFGVAAAVGKLLNYGAEGIHNALAVAGTFSGGLMQYDQGGGSVKRIFTAVAAIGGLQAAMMAQAGITGPEGILEGNRGLLKIYPESYNPERLTSDLGHMWTLEHVLFKPYCCCAIIHPAIDALLKILVERAVRADDIEAIEVGYPKGSHHHAAITHPKDILGMQFSTAYSLALTVVKGKNTPKEYSLEALDDPAIKAIAAKVSLTNEVGLDKLFEGHMPARIKLKTRGGKAYDELVIDAKGSPLKRLSSAEIDEKFRSMVIDILGEERTGRIIQTLRNVESVKDMASVLPMLVL
ncbi:MAG TPA: MmgE/PrpD family protein [Steroidobacteraceae bacterium]|nr:MmgE/PrpD family protein [Steroidobacteraceae bacterium]